MRRGWFGERHRHYLAAKGISSRYKYFYRVASGAEMSPQLHFGDLEGGVKLHSRGEPLKVSMSGIPKPRVKGGEPRVLWTSTFRPGRSAGDSDWMRFTQDARFYPPEKSAKRSAYVVKFKPDARIAQIRNEEDAKKFFAEFGNMNEIGKSIPESQRKDYSMNAFIDVDWDAVARKFDAVQLTKSGLEAAKSAEFDAINEKFELWDSESTVILNKEAIESMRKLAPGELADYAEAEY